MRYLYCCVVILLCSLSFASPMEGDIEMGSLRRPFLVEIESEGPDLTCPICFEVMDMHTDTLGRLPCMHYYHKACIGQWAAIEKTTCPKCIGSFSEIKDYDARIALYEAIDSGNLDVIQRFFAQVPSHTLVERLSVVDDRNRTLIYLAVARHQVKLVRFLLKQLCGLGEGAIEEAKGDDSVYNTGLMETVVNMPNDHGLTPLHVAIVTRAGLEMVEVLLTHGAQVGIKDEKGVTPLHCACWVVSADRSLIVQLLLQRGADPHALSAVGETPLDRLGSLSLAVRESLSEEESVRARVLDDHITSLPEVLALFKAEGIEMTRKQKVGVWCMRHRRSLRVLYVVGGLIMVAIFIQLPLFLFKGYCDFPENSCYCRYHPADGSHCNVTMSDG